MCGARSWIESEQIWRIEPRTGQTHRVTSDLDSYAAVVVRQDGSALAARRTTNDSHMWLVSTNGTPEDNVARAERLTRGTDFSGHPNVHPNGERVLFSSNADGHLNFWTMNLDGSDRKQLTFSASQDFWGHWSPDGESIVYASEQDGNLQVWVMTRMVRTRAS